MKARFGEESMLAGEHWRDGGILLAAPVHTRGRLRRGGAMRRRGIVLRPGAVGASALVLALLLGGCAGSGSGGSTDRLGTNAPTVAGVTAVPPSGGSANVGNAPTDGPEGSAARAALSAYQDWWQAQAEAFGKADSDGSRFEIFASGKALTEALVNLRQLHEAKLVMTGEPRNSAVVKSVDLTADPHTAVIEDCLDVSGWHQADAATLAVKDPPDRLNRYVATVSLRLFQTRWLINEFKREVGRTC
ncbi:hypothetical protein [Kitasatospora sp. NPDC056184]|uniref:hypothetical protein n=1 Tax=Kitasatospora sp. NPDC056184 TaxID=3345738 RepID=UPI0035E0380F